MFRSPVISRARVAFAHDTVMAALSFLLSLWLRLGSQQLRADWTPGNLALATGLFTLTAATVFLSLRLYRGVWRYASTTDLLALTRAATLTVLIFIPVLFLFTRLHDLPRSLLGINWFVLLALLGGPRFIYRVLRDRRLDLKLERQREESGARRIPVLLVGSGDGADLFIRATQQGDVQYRAVGILTAKKAQVGQGMHGVIILGLFDALEEVVAGLAAKGLAPERLVLTEEDFDGGLVRDLFDRADALGLPLARLPRLTDLKDGMADRMEIKPVAVEDLLGRPQTVLDRSGLTGLIAGKRVLVTGAGGSIGSELVRQISDCGPSLLLLAEASEFALYTIDQELGLRHPGLARLPLIADVRDRARITEIMAAHTPELVFHAAALKHVPMVEGNPLDGCLTNAVGTRIVADACIAHHVALMVLISTDKAVNPTNVMGASKRMAERYCQAMDMAGGGTRFVTVRFGNVLGSTGSVVPLFQKQLAAGGPITVTHPDMTRYFMTIREAVELVLQAATLGMQQAALYQGRIFVLDMGEPVKIVHLARQMVRMAGLRPDQDIAITFTGLRPGEKLFEEIFHGAEPPVPTGVGGILVAAVRASDQAAIAAALDRLEQACRSRDFAAAMTSLRALVPEYSGNAGRDI